MQNAVTVDRDAVELSVFVGWRCTGDYVMVYVLRNGSRPIRRSRFCRITSRHVFTHIGAMRIRFVTDQEVSNRGFLANFNVSRQYHISLASHVL